ncbi:MAG: PAS domain-containing protein [Anaerolineaceae bacterium]|nr:PAS domain-containing protein [Anaerolineaceae bacterium]
MQVLMIEDNENDYLLVNNVMKKSSDVVLHWQSTLKAGLLYLQSNTVDVILLDLGLPDAHGLNAIDRLQTEFPLIPIIILSANDTDELALESVRHGAQDYLLKGKADDYVLNKALRYAIERKRLEERLRRSEEIHRTFAQNFPNGTLAIFDHNLQYTLVDGLGLAGLGLSKERMEGKTIWDVFPPELAAAGEIRMRKSLAGEEVVEEIVFAGQIVLMNYVPIRDAAGVIVSGMIMSQNITNRKQAEAALAAERNLLRTLIDSIPDYVYIKDTQSRFVLANRSVLNASGLENIEQLIGKSDFDMMPQAIAQSFYDDDRTVLSSGQPLIDREEPSIDLKTGEELWFSTTKVPLRDENGSVTGLVGVSRDIRHRKQLEAALKLKIEEELNFQNYLKALHEITIELTTINEIDEFYKRAVELGLQRLGFDRLGLLLYEQETGVAVGTWGTDAQGHVVAEHDLRIDPSALTNILKRSLQKEERFAVDENTPLFSNFKQIGLGWNAAAVLWNGSEKIGWLAADNVVRHEALSQNQMNVLALYAVTLGTLLAQKRSQIAVRESEKGLRLLAENSPDYIYILSLTDPGQIYINRPEFLGYNQSEMQAAGSLLDAVHPADKERVVAHWQAVTKGNENQHDGMIEYRMRDKAGGWRWIQSRETIFASDTDGKPTQILVTLTDISERKKAEESLRQERDLLRTLIENTPDYISLKDREGRFLLVNKALAEASNLMPEDMIGKMTSDILPKHLASRFHEDDMKVIKSGKPVVNAEQDTGEKTLLTSKMPVRDNDGQVTGIISISRDITEHKQLESQKLELEAERGRIKLLQSFINDMSHDFRTPLTTINTSLYLLKRTTDSEKRDAYLSRAQQDIRRMDKLLEELLQMEYLDKGDTKFEFSLTDMNLFIPSLIHDYESLMTPKQITVKFVTDVETCVALIDQVEFARAITNLMDNAIAYTPQSGEISIHVDVQGDWAIVSIQDTGIGISASDLPHIFERFYRADQARSTETGGSGLGLSIVQKIIDAHSGQINVESEPGVGSKFTIRLPLAR